MMKEVAEILNCRPEIISQVYASVKELKETTDVKEVSELVASQQWVVLAVNSNTEIPLFSLGRVC